MRTRGLKPSPSRVFLCSNRVGTLTGGMRRSSIHAHLPGRASHGGEAAHGSLVRRRLLYCGQARRGVVRAAEGDAAEGADAVFVAVVQGRGIALAREDLIPVLPGRGVLPAPLNRFDVDGQDTYAQLARVVPHAQLGRDEGLIDEQLQSKHVVGSELGRRERSINHHGRWGIERQFLQYLFAESETELLRRLEHVGPSSHLKHQAGVAPGIPERDHRVAGSPSPGGLAVGLALGPVPAVLVDEEAALVLRGERDGGGPVGVLADIVTRSSTSRNESEYRRYQRTAQRISSGSVCRHLKIAGRIAFFMISSGYQPQPKLQHIPTAS